MLMRVVEKKKTEKKKNSKQLKLVSPACSLEHINYRPNMKTQNCILLLWLAQIGTVVLNPLWLQIRH